MTDVTIRTPDLATNTDSEAIAALTTQAFPFLLEDGEYVRFRLRSEDPAVRSLVLLAEADGQIIGFAHTYLDPESSAPGATAAKLVVDEAWRGRGVGTALMERLSAHWAQIGSRVVAGRVASAQALAFAQTHGFAVNRRERISHLSLAEIPSTPAVAGIDLRPLSELDDLRPLHQIDSAVIGDIPSDAPFLSLSFEDWSRIYGGDPRTDHHSTVLAFDGDTPVAVAWIDRIDRRVWSSLTGTHPDYRGRGLAKLVKCEALRRARDTGATDAYTNNDATNAGMLAVNTWLGYRPHVTQHMVQIRLA